MATSTTPQPYTAERPENSTTSVDANQWLVVPLWFPTDKDSLPTDSGGIPLECFLDPAARLEPGENRVRLSELVLGVLVSI